MTRNMFSASWGREVWSYEREGRCSKSKGGKFYVKFDLEEGKREPVADKYGMLKRKYFVDEETKECSQRRQGASAESHLRMQILKAVSP